MAMTNEKQYIESLEEMVFKNRNKEYGSYQLRKKYKKYVLISLALGLFLLGAVIAYPLVKSLLAKENFGKKTQVEVSVDLKKMENAPPPPPPPPPAEKIVEQVKFVAPKVTTDTTQVTKDFGKQAVLVETGGPPPTIEPVKVEPVIEVKKEVDETPFMVRIANEMLKQGMIDEKASLLRIEPQKLDELLHPVFDPKAVKAAKVVAKGLPASPGAATGRIVFFADDAEAWAERREKVILVRIETSPEDLRGMHVAQGILTARGGMTSHAAVVARGMGKCCVSGAGEIKIDYKVRTITMRGTTYKEGDWISLNGSTGDVYDGKVTTQDAEVSGDFAEIMKLADKYAKMEVRTNADTPHALRFCF